MKANSFYAKYIKRALDFLCAFFAIIVFCWLYAIIAILVRAKLGSPVLFRQYRPGKNEKLFMLYKFRSMSDARDENGDLLPDSKRLTRFGRMLRATSLDELPEVFNILKGDMSLIGPRPWSIYDLKYYSDKERKRFSVAPGLSGWAQVNGRNNAAWEDRLRMDEEYTDQVSLGMDLKIVLMTVGKMIKRSDVVVRGEGNTSEFAVCRLLEEQTRTEPEVLPEQEIGGFFELDTEPQAASDMAPAPWLPHGADSVYTFSGRDAINLAIRDLCAEKHMKPKSVYFPAYCSVTMAEPFLEHGINVQFYEIDYTGTQLTYHIDLAKNCDIFFGMQYYGARNKQMDAAISSFHQRGIPVIEDITHSLLDCSPCSEESDYCVASLRKWLAIPSGGYLLKRKGKLRVRPERDGMSAAMPRLEAMRRKGEYLRGSVENIKALITLNQRCDTSLIYERNLNIDPISAGILKELKINSVREKRRQNATALSEALKEIKGLRSAFPTEEFETICPLFFPVVVEDYSRDDIKEYLEHYGVFCSIHWPERMGTALGLRRHELSIPCDQRYSETDMKRIVNLIRQYENGKTQRYGR